MNKYARLAKAARTARHRLRSCLSKRAYNTREEAACAKQEAYQCRYCHKWHRTCETQKLIAATRLKFESPHSC